jgi:glutathione S-transferase
MIQLYQFPSRPEILNLSPFCMKVELYLKMAKIPYQTVSIRNPAKAPKGKVPFIIDEGKKIADSAIIIDYLEHKYNQPLDAHLTLAQQAEKILIQRLLDEHFAWILTYSRWVDENYNSTALDMFFGKKRGLLMRLIAKKVQAKMVKSCFNQGIGRHSAEEVYQFGMEDLIALDRILEHRTYGLGEQVSSVDACIYAHLANIVEIDLDTPLRQQALQLPHLMAYVSRMKLKLQTS